MFLHPAALSGGAGSGRRLQGTLPAGWGRPLHLAHTSACVCTIDRPQVGTEEGLVHCCSTSLSEQGRQPYRGHLAPVYQARGLGWGGAGRAWLRETVCCGSGSMQVPLGRGWRDAGRWAAPAGSALTHCAVPLTGPMPPQVCWSPFSPSHFLTASADWSVRLWDEAQPRRALATLQLPGATAEVADAAFCPAAATLLAAAAGNTLQVGCSLGPCSVAGLGACLCRGRPSPLSQYGAMG